jgi:hypothetical protein
VKLKTQWAHFSYTKRLHQFEFSFQPSIDEKKIRELASLAFLEHKENVIPAPLVVHLALLSPTPVHLSSGIGLLARYSR